MGENDNIGHALNVKGPAGGGGDRREEERLQGLLPAPAQQAEELLSEPTGKSRVRDDLNFTLSYL